MSLIPLLEDPPWWRISNRTRKVEGYEDNAWKTLDGDEKLRVNKHAAQVWLALNNLVVDPECRKKVRWMLRGGREIEMMINFTPGQGFFSCQV